MRTVFLTFVALIIPFLCVQTQAQQSVVDSLLAIEKQNLQDTNHVKALNSLATEFSRKDFQKSREYLYRAIRLAERINMVRGLSGSYYQLTTSHQNQGNLDSAWYYLEKSKVLQQNNPNDDLVQANYYFLAGLFYKNQGKYKEALPFMLKGLNYISPHKQVINLAGQYLNIGNTYYKMGEISLAAEYHLKSLQIFESINNQRGESFCLQSLGNDLLELNQFEKAKSYFQRSLQMKEKLNDSRGIGNAWLGLGVVEKNLKNYKDAYSYFDKALKQAKDLNITIEQGKILYEIALLDKVLGNHSMAQSKLKESLKFVRIAGDSSLSATVAAELTALIHRENKVVSLPESSYQLKVKAAETSGDKNSMVDGYYQLSEWYRQQKQYDLAYEYLRKYNSKNDSLRGIDVLVQLKRLEEQYENEKKQKEIELLRKDGEIKEATIARQNANQRMIMIAVASFVIIALVFMNRYRVVQNAQRMVAIEKVRSALARDLHDDIGSTLSSININSKLALQEKNNMEKYLERISENSSRILENMSDIVWSIRPGNDSFEQVVIKMKEFAAEILEPRNIQYEVTGEQSVNDLPVGIENRKNLFLIFKEALNNAAKYSCAKEMKIRFEKEDKLLRLTISDNGKGFEINQNGKGNGLRNMEYRAKALGGKFFITSNLGKGTSVVLEVALT